MSKQALKDGILVSIKDQILALYKNGALIKQYSVSTSLKAPSCQENSWGTPWGKHTIADKIGAGAPVGMVFQGRQPTGKLYTEYAEQDQAADLITTRILRLRGEEKGLNCGQGCDSYKRMIYIHGTNQEALIGAPASHGCIRMHNDAVVELFDCVEVGTWVLIQKEDLPFFSS